jgi:hypothetical protein
VKKPLLLTAVLLVSAWPVHAAPGREPPTPEERARRITAAYWPTYHQMSRKACFQFCREPVVRRLWGLIGEWLAAELDAHPTASAEALVASLARLDQRPAGPPAENEPPLEADAMALLPGDFLVILRYAETGTFLVVGRSPNGKARVKWAIDRYARSPGVNRELGCWPVQRDCGPLFSGPAKPLPPTSKGEPRFYINAIYAGNGLTVGAQTSIWAWNGRNARPLVVRNYAVWLDDDRPTRCDGEHLVVPVKPWPRSFWAGGDMRDPQGTWTARLTPDGAEDLGERWNDPELQWADQFFDALRKRRDTRRLAAPEVARKLKTHLKTHRDVDLGGMLMEWSATHGTPDTFSIWVLDAGKFTFTLVRRGDHLYATAVEVKWDQ